MIDTCRLPWLIKAIYHVPEDHFGPYDIIWVCAGMRNLPLKYVDQRNHDGDV